jgi:predicted transcriptional regulator
MNLHRTEEPAVRARISALEKSGRVDVPTIANVLGASKSAVYKWLKGTRRMGLGAYLVAVEKLPELEAQGASTGEAVLCDGRR